MNQIEWVLDVAVSSCCCECSDRRCGARLAASHSIVEVVGTDYCDIDVPSSGVNEMISSYREKVAVSTDDNGLQSGSRRLSLLRRKPTLDRVSCEMNQCWCIREILPMQPIPGHYNDLVFVVLEFAKALANSPSMMPLPQPGHHMWGIIPFLVYSQAGVQLLAFHVFPLRLVDGLSQNLLGSVKCVSQFRKRRYFLATCASLDFANQLTVVHFRHQDLIHLRSNLFHRLLWEWPNCDQPQETDLQSPSRPSTTAASADLATLP